MGKYFHTLLIGVGPEAEDQGLINRYFEVNRIAPSRRTVSPFM